MTKDSSTLEIRLRQAASTKQIIRSESKMNI